VAAPLKAVGPLVRLAERGRELAPISAFALCRHRFIDEHLLDALDDTDQVVVLGAGYDSRAYRFSAQLAGRAVYEVDLPPLSRRKAASSRRIRTCSAEPPSTVSRSTSAGRSWAMCSPRPASRAAPGPTSPGRCQSVSERAAVSATLETLRDLCGPDSIVALDFWDGIGGTGLLAPVRRWVRPRSGWWASR